MTRELPRAEALSSKAVNQYRGRDIFSYLGLRYCLDTAISRRDSWAAENAIQVVLGSPKGRYLKSFHFKALAANGDPEHRVLMVPGPTEALAEAALLAECAPHWVKERHPHIYSYLPTQRNDRSGYFARYMEGLRERQSSIADECRNRPGSCVSYVDVRRFYPSIRPVLAQRAWDAFCSRQSIGEQFKALGHKLIDNYASETNGASILTGPMFSHFLANLVLRDLDAASSKLPAKYFRYVDDITLVGSETEISDSLKTIGDLLSGIGLSLHVDDPRKSLLVSCEEWLVSASDFNEDPSSTSWMRLVGNIKKFLIFHPRHASDLDERLLNEGFRFPIPDYSLARQEMSMFEKVRRFGLWAWLFRRSSGVTADRIVEDAHRLRTRMEAESARLLESFAGQSAFQRKRAVSKLRYRLGRLAYLSPAPVLSGLGEGARGIEDLAFHSALLQAIVTTDCSEVVSLGTNVAQATAQIMRAIGETASFSRPVATEAEYQGLAILIINGVSVEATVRSETHPLLKLASRGVDADLMTQPRGFIQELACLHGLGPPRHYGMMKTAFDVDQEIALDALEFDYGYYL